MHTKKLLILIALLLVAVAVGAEIKYTPLVPLPSDIDARVNYPEPDRSSGRAGELCAIIKIVHGDMDFNFDIGSTLIIAKTVPHPELGELWVYVPVGTNHIKIYHPKYGHLDTPDGYYWFEGGLRCQSGVSYRLRLETDFIADDEDIVTDDTQVQKVQFVVKPSNASIRIRKIPLQTEKDGTFDILLPIGTFHYRVSSDEYYDSDGVIETKTDSEIKVVNVTLQHRQGMLFVQTSEMGANVQVDGYDVGKTPMESPVLLNTGVHNVQISCPNYRTEMKTVNIKDGMTDSLYFYLASTTMFTIDSNPPGAALYIDGVRRGNTPNSLELASGDYNIRITKSRYKDFAGIVHMDSSQPMQSFSLSRIYQKRGCFYAQTTVQFGSVAAFGPTVGFYICGINVEASHLMVPMCESDVIYLNSDNGDYPYQNIFKPKVFSIKGGYGITLGTRFKLTPQIGVSVVNISNEINADLTRSVVFDVSGYCVSGAIGTRCDFALIRGIELFAAPEFDFAISKSSTFEDVASVSSKVAGWSNGFNMRTGFTFFF